MVYAKYAFQCRQEVDVMRPITIFRHLHHANHNQHCQNNKPDNQIRRNQYHQVRITYRSEFNIRKLTAFHRIHRVQAILNKIHRHVHTQQRAHRVKRLCEIQAAGGCSFITHRKNIRITTCLQKRESACQDKVGNEEGIVIACQHGRIKEECTDSIQPQP